MAKPAKQTNDFESAVVQRLLSKLDGYDGDLASEKGSYMNRCRTIRDAIAGVYDEAKAQGVPKRELKILKKIRDHDKAQQKLITELEPEDRETLAMLARATGEPRQLSLFPEMDAGNDNEPTDNVTKLRN